MSYNLPTWLKPAFLCTGASLARFLYRMLRGPFHFRLDPILAIHGLGRPMALTIYLAEAARE